ncbi:hypothetical protein ACIQZB_28675 [Streptomyces sp. NPDC097727]|uniref:hypothetical protein n=1 Tax=Streptomyces sp. NPDC097727 TaxID=3366092 RepID=UPI00380B6082
MSTHGDPLKTLGPATGLAQVFASFEPHGHADPAGAWRAFTGTWNWAAPLTAAVPRTGLPRTPVVRHASGGFALSGLWHLTLHEGTGPWLALPLAAGERRSEQESGRGVARPGADGPDLFVVPAKSLPGAVLGPAGDQDASSGPVFRLAGVHVPTGFATHTTGTPLRAQDAAFLWTTVAALALGAARRMIDVLAGRTPDADTPREPVAPAVLTAELAAVLHDERLSLAAALHGAPAARHGLPPALEERLAAQVRQVANVVHHVLAAAYEYALTAGGHGDHYPLVSIIEASSPILQQARYATELLPPDDRTSRRKAEHGDNRRISG